jgi:hypothetical protein
LDDPPNAATYGHPAALEEWKHRFAAKLLLREGAIGYLLKFRILDIPDLVDATPSPRPAT